MRALIKTVLSISTVILCSGAYSDVPNHNHPTTFVGPTLALKDSSFIRDGLAYSLAAELGLDNFRLSGTLGMMITPNQRIKATIEGLYQDLRFSFFTGNYRHWVYQTAYGIDYQYDAWSWLSADLAAYYSYAPGHNLNSVLAFYPVNIAAYNMRRIAGSTAYGIAPGVTASPWTGANTALKLNYDHVRYSCNNEPSVQADGFGGTVSLNQQIFDFINVGALAGIRQPFNQYQADISWTNISFHGRWNVGVMGEYVDGKRHLENDWNVLLHFDYFWDPLVALPYSYKGDFKNEGPATARLPNSFVNWVADPAVRMPKVLAIADQQTRLRCQTGFPVVVGPIPGDFAFINNVPTTFPTASSFSGPNLIFSVTFTSADPIDNVTINASTGVVTITPDPIGQFRQIFINVTATNGCGSVSQPFAVTASNFT